MPLAILLQFFLQKGQGCLAFLFCSILSHLALALIPYLTPNLPDALTFLVLAIFTLVLVGF
jgi:accessory gene regulator protein AgrB